ncbi:hypothetical protein Lepto7375DRAFT_7343 [Leptolyngbya sp. PCC 7375]|nr:hypothetical protein Lepto7375DRAFT_7343 [Leptolyngbya sp. PCC 7375]
MANPYLQLKLGSITVRFEGFIFEDGVLPRSISPEQAGTITYSAEGGVAVDGTANHPKHLWTFSVATDVIYQYQPSLPDAVRNLWAEYDEQRRAGNNPLMELEDGSQYFFESSPRTRALATGAAEIATTAGRIKYYAKFYAGFERPPEFQIGEGFTIQLREGAIFPA